MATVADASSRTARMVIKASIKQAESLIAPTKSTSTPRRRLAASCQSRLHTTGTHDNGQKYLLQLKEQYAPSRAHGPLENLEDKGKRSGKEKRCVRCSSFPFPISPQAF